MNTTWYKDFDWLTILIWVTITTFGLVGIYSATLGPVSEFLPAHIQANFSRQLVWVAISVVALIFIQFTSPRSFQQLAYVVYGVGLILTASTIFVGVEVNAAKSWLEIGGIRFQTSEIMKIATILGVANYLTSRRNIEAVNLKTAIVATTMILIPVAIIVLQNDTGSALIFLPLIPVMLFLSGLPYGISLLMISPAIIGYLSIINWKYGVAATIFFTVAIYLLQKRPWLGVTTLLAGLILVTGVNFALTDMLQPHQQNRIEAFVNPFQDPQGAGWNIIQAKTAISSGGIYGKGFMQGTQTQMRFLPEQWTDFIFCVIAEDFGLLGGALAIFALLLLLMRQLSNAQSMKTPFAQLVIVGVVTIYFTHILVNLGSAMGVVPVIGVPLPFMSYGGSSYLSNSIMLGVCLNLYFRQREMSPFA
ncbi:MAG: rod shape-determining protein RodA [Balneolales bacterium]|nr:rod shape-determining protein RodA [Balneolales bacterium]